MKHEAQSDLRRADSSHSLLVDLIGPDRRVLDVGSGGGALDRALMARGCRVTRVEQDPGAAQAPEAELEEVVVADVEEIDLVGRFGKKSFDVVLLKDVLQHVVDPVAVLRKVRALLMDSGSIVASVPNAAHGSVRLALLSGDLRGGPLGLLDPPPRRLFTRVSVHEVLREAGLVPVDVRRITAGVFETGLALRREDFEQEVVDAVEGDPESSTYRYVLRARPEESVDAISADVPATRSSIPGEPRLGVWSVLEPDDLRAALVLRVTVAELARRLPSAVVRSFAASVGAVPSISDGGLAIETLGPWSAERASRLGTELDCVVVTGLLSTLDGSEDGDGEEPVRYLVDGVGQYLECPVVWSAVDRSGAVPPAGALAGPPPYRTVMDGCLPAGQDDAATVVPDPLLLLPRLLDRAALARRLEFVRTMGWFPIEERAVTVEVDGSMLQSSEALAGGLDAVLSGTDAVVVLVPVGRRDPEGRQAAVAVAAAMRRPALVVGEEAVVDDVVAMIGCAAAVVARSSAALATGLAYDVPVALLAGGSAAPGPLLTAAAGAGSWVTSSEDLAGLLDDERFAPDAPVVAAQQAELEAHFDRVAAIAGEAARARLRARDLPPRLPAAEYVIALELSHRRIRERLDTERAALAAYLEGLRRQHQRETAHLRVERDELTSKLREAIADGGRHQEGEQRVTAELDRAEAELVALENTRLLRLVRPARSLYARLRGTRL